MSDTGDFILRYLYNIDMQSRQVQILHRHGDRAPYQNPFGNTEKGLEFLNYWDKQVYLFYFIFAGCHRTAS